MTKRTVTIDFDDLEMAMQDQHETWYIDPANGQMCMDAEDAEAMFGDDAMKPTDPDDVLEIPPFFSSDGYRLMESFAESLEDRNASAKLLDALDRSKPFRRFKDALCDFPEIRQAWFVYHAEQLRKIAEDYYESEGIHVEWKSG